MITLRGWNDFYEGWLTGAFNVECASFSKSEEWKAGFETAMVHHPLQVLESEILFGHIIVSTEGEKDAIEAKPNIPARTDLFTAHNTGGHFVVKCSVCKKVMGGCRCISPNKDVQWSTCEECMRKLHSKEI